MGQERMFTSFNKSSDIHESAGSFEFYFSEDHLANKNYST